MIDRITRDFKLEYQYFESQTTVTCHIRSVRDYLSKIFIFLERLLLPTHIITGQFARSTEILGIHYCNLFQREYHNIFIENELTSIVTIYHKNYIIEEKSKIIHRYLLHAIAEL